MLGLLVPRVQEQVFAARNFTPRPNFSRWSCAAKSCLKELCEQIMYITAPNVLASPSKNTSSRLRESLRFPVLSAQSSMYSALSSFRVLPASFPWIALLHVSCCVHHVLVQSVECSVGCCKCSAVGSFTVAARLSAAGLEGVGAHWTSFRRQQCEQRDLPRNRIGDRKTSGNCLLSTVWPARVV